MRLIVAIRHTVCKIIDGNLPLIFPMASRHYNSQMAKTPAFPSDAAEKFIIRLPPGMRERISEAAKESKRSMNSEVVHRLQESFDPKIDLREYFRITELEAHLRHSRSEVFVLAAILRHSISLLPDDLSDVDKVFFAKAHEKATILIDALEDLTNPNVIKRRLERAAKLLEASIALDRRHEQADPEVWQAFVENAITERDHIEQEVGLLGEAHRASGLEE